MNKFSKIVESNQFVNVGVTPLNTELVYITENQEQVGSLLLVYEKSKASVFSLEVLVDHRKKGYGRKLMENAISRCEEKGCNLLELNTEINNNAANKLYQSMGFQLNGLKSGFNNYTKSI
jgi:[ribosomal protein S18]-alanine N-acetyltransferase